MSTLTLLPDGERILGDYLRDHPDIEALGANVAGRTPSSMAKPWVRITQLNAPKSPGSTPEHLINFTFQLDAYAGDGAVKAHTGQAEASLLARTVRAALDAMPAETFGDVVVTQALITGMPRIPDTSDEPARERYVITATVRMHAKAA